jgi:hypothetical protein
MESNSSFPCPQEPATGPIINQNYPVHTKHPIYLRTTSILFSNLRLFLVVSILLAYPQEPCMHISSAQACYVSCLSHPSLLHYSNYISRRTQVMKFLSMQFSSSSYHFIIVFPNILLSTSFSITFSLCQDGFLLIFSLMTFWFVTSSKYATSSSHLLALVMLWLSVHSGPRHQHIICDYF